MTKFEFLPYQRSLMESVKRECLLSGGLGTGKSYAITSKLVFLLLRYSHTVGFLGRATLQSLKSSTLKTLLDHNGNLPSVLPREFIELHNKTDRHIVLKNGSELYYGNLDINFLKSVNLNFACIDEITEVDLDTYNMALGRLRMTNSPLQQMICATNPAGANHWVYNRFKINPLTDINGELNSEFIQSATFENKYLPPEYLDSLKKTLFGTYLRRYYYGEWVSNENVVYDNFDPRTHIIKNFSIPQYWKKVRSFDFGYKAPFSCLWIVICGDDCKQYNEKLENGDLVVYREIYYTERTADVNAESVVRHSKTEDDVEEKYLFNIADHAAGERASLEARGIRTVPASKDIVFGIQKVRERLGNVDPSMGNVIRPRLYIFENTLCEYDPKIRVDRTTGQTNNDPVKLTDELSVYSWKKSIIGNKEEPEDKFNHASDNLRYAIMAIDLKAQWKSIDFIKV